MYINKISAMISAYNYYHRRNCRFYKTSRSLYRESTVYTYIYTKVHLITTVIPRHYDYTTTNR